MDARRIIACLLLFACLAPLAQADKRFRIPNNPYRKQWAIVIGINYEGREDVAAEGVSALKNAENDANALAETLKQYYGYTDDSIRLLLGKDATKAEILKLFGDGFLCDHDTVTTDDSVLVFFAGHGDRQSRNDRTRAVIWPYDVQAIEGKGVDSSSCVRISNILADLELSDARHKLLVLDSCHSGEVFRSGGLTRSSGRFRYDPELFENKVLQAMAASRGFQKAQDGEGHSPFTVAMLESLTGGIDSSSFGASALFSRVPERVKEFSKQDPRGGTISGDGEFYFFRTGAPEKIDVSTFGMVPVKDVAVAGVRSEETAAVADAATTPAAIPVAQPGIWKFMPMAQRRKA